jgi:hypothetical protein
MRPIKSQPVAHRSTEQLADRYAQCLGLDIDEGIFDRTDCLLIDPARRLSGGGIQKSRDSLDRSWILTDEKPVGELVDDASQPLRAIPFHILRPTDDPLIGGDFEKRIDPPTRVAMQVLDFDDLHQ